MTSEPSDFSADLARLRSELEARGFHTHPVAPVLAALAAHLALGLGGLALFVRDPWSLLGGAGLILSCVGFIAASGIGHTASHHAVSKQRWVNRALFFFIYPLVLDMSAGRWVRTHIQLHHAHPNVVGVDDDCDLRPGFTITEAHAAEALFSRWQWLVLPLALPLNGVGVFLRNWSFVVRQLIEPAQRSRDAWIDLACLTAHVLLWLGLPMCFFPAGSVLGVYLLRLAVFSVLLFGLLTPAHYPAEAACLADAPAPDGGDFYFRQTIATVNFRTGRLGRFLCSGLEYQIEHHLFPGISHVHYPRMAPLVKAFCERNRLPYRSLGWAEGIWKSYRAFVRLKPVHLDLEPLRPSSAHPPELS